VTPHWSRYNVPSSAGALSVAEARRLPALSEAAGEQGYGGQGVRFTIHRAAPSAMTSGKAAATSWRVRASHAPKWSNPLMGWVSSADTASPPAAMQLRFESAAAAVLWAERAGVPYEVNAAAVAAPAAGRVDNQYAYNFLPRDVMARMKRAGPRGATAIFANAAATGGATFVNQRRTQFGQEPWAPAAYQTATAWTGPDWPAPVKKRPAGAAAEEQH